MPVKSFSFEKNAMISIPAPRIAAASQAVQGVVSLSFGQLGFMCSTCSISPCLTNAASVYMCLENRRDDPSKNERPKAMY